MTNFRVEIWGVRGSIPTPGPATVRYGGNTTCVSVEVTGKSGKQQLILDAGTGIRELGNRLMAYGENALDLMISHTHWDHIQGLPFFGPLFAEHNSIRVWGARQGSMDLEAVLRRLMDPVVFPVPLDSLDADLAVSHVTNGRIELEHCHVDTMRVRHPGHTLAMRLRVDATDRTVAFVPDNELGPGGDYDVADNWRRDFVKFLEGTSLLIHDAMYLPESMDALRGWGHSTYEEAVDLAADASVETLVLFHHSPERDDDGMDALVVKAQEYAVKRGAALEICAGSEGMVLNV